MIDTIRIILDGKIKKVVDLSEAKAQIRARVGIDSHCQSSFIHSPIQQVFIECLGTV